MRESPAGTVHTYGTCLACLSICLEKTFKRQFPLRIMSKVAGPGPKSDREGSKRHAREVE
jgi:hypothetical protein